MHEVKKILHQDIKLDNLLHNVLTGEIKIADLGFTIPIKDVHKVPIAGTEGYKAPELNLKPPVREPCNDIYSLAISFLRLLTGDNDTP